MTSSKGSRVALAALLLLTVALGSRGISDESAVMLRGDMARYIMNGVFLHDLIADGGVFSWGALVDYAEKYYARYPALTLGHHPLLPSVALLPFFALFGVSLSVARLAAVVWFGLAAWGLYALGRRLFGWQVAAWATLLFVTNVFVLRAGQYVLSEMPMLALVLWATSALLRFCDTGRTSHFVWFLAAVVASLAAKVLAAFMFPVYVSIIVARLGWRGFRRRPIAVTAAVGGLIAVPLAIATIALSPGNLRIAMNSVTRLFGGLRIVPASSIFEAIFSAHLSWPVAGLAIAGAVRLAFQKRWQASMLLGWVVFVVGATFVFVGPVEPARYSFGVMPAYFLLAAGVTVGWSSLTARRAAAVALAAGVIWQVTTIRDIRPSGAGGYEEAATYVLEHGQEPVMLLDTQLDTGYFVFFVRKHDPGGRIVLRADKLWPPPGGFEPEINRPSDHDRIISSLHTFGVRYIVVEDLWPRQRMLQVLHTELKTPAFAERLRVPIVTTDSLATGVDLVVYEFLDAATPDRNAIVDIGLPLGRREITLRLGDLLEGGR